MTEQAMPAAHPSRVSEFFEHQPLRRLLELRQRAPVQSADMRVGLNGRIGLFITTIVGTMECAYVFCIIAAVGGYAIVAGNQTLNLVVILISQTFLQLVLLPVIIVGQNIQGRAADQRAVETYKDAEAILQACVHLQDHLMAQDKLLDDIVSHIHTLSGAQPST